MEIRQYTAYDEAEIARLYADAGWTAYTRDLPALREGFARSLCVLAAYEDGELLGLLRAVGDGATIVYIQDILVFRSLRRRGRLLRFSRGKGIKETHGLRRSASLIRLFCA